MIRDSSVPIVDRFVDYFGWRLEGGEFRRRANFELFSQITDQPGTQLIDQLANCCRTNLESIW